MVKIKSISRVGNKINGCFETDSGETYIGTIFDSNVNNNGRIYNQVSYGVAIEEYLIKTKRLERIEKLNEIFKN